jgi:hypothetical protein
MSAAGDFSGTVGVWERGVTEFRIVRWLQLAALPCALAAQSVMPSPADLIAKAIAAEKAQEARGNKYTFREDHTQRDVEKNGKLGKPSTDTSDHIMLEGSDYEKLILLDGKPLSAKRQKQVDDEMEKERIRRKKNGPPRTEVSLGDLDVLDRLFDNKVTGEELVGDRKAWRMESEPKPGVKPGDKKDEQAIASRRVFWFDEEDGYPIRQTNEFVRAAGDFEPGSTTEIKLMRIGDDWVGDDFYIRADMKVLPGVHASVDSHQHFYNYKRFSVDSAFTPQ